MKTFSHTPRWLAAKLLRTYGGTLTQRQATALMRQQSPGRSQQTYRTAWAHYQRLRTPVTQAQLDF